jgi:hypothetical protein
MDKILVVSVGIPFTVILVCAFIRSRAHLPQHPGADYLAVLVSLDLGMLVDPATFSPIVVSATIRNDFATWVLAGLLCSFAAWAFVLGVAERHLLALYDYSTKTYGSLLAYGWLALGSFLAWGLLAVHIGGFMISD